MSILSLFSAVVGLLVFGNVSSTTLPKTEAPINNNSTSTIATVNTTSTESAKSTTSSLTSEQKEKLAKCLTQKGVIMYGAYWCPHCQNQKAEFGDAVKDLTYQECDAKGENGKPELCQKAGVTGFPSWKIPGKDLLTGEQSLADLAQKADCQY